MAEAIDYKSLGTRPVRPDGVDRVTGRAGSVSFLPKPPWPSTARRVSGQSKNSWKEGCPFFALAQSPTKVESNT